MAETLSSEQKSDLDDDEFLYGDEADLDEIQKPTIPIEQLKTLKNRSSEEKGDAPEKSVDMRPLSTEPLTPEPSTSEQIPEQGERSRKNSEVTSRNGDNKYTRTSESSDLKRIDEHEITKPFVDTDDSDTDDDDDIQITIGDITKKSSYTIEPKKLTRKGTYQNKSTPSNVVNTGVVQQTKSFNFNDKGDIDGHPVVEYDLSGATEKAWRKPGADLTDFFNYGFTEETWLRYCDKQRRLRSENNYISKNRSVYKEESKSAPIPSEPVEPHPPSLLSNMPNLNPSGAMNQMLSNINMNIPTNNPIQQQQMATLAAVAAVAQANNQMPNFRMPNTMNANIALNNPMNSLSNPRMNFNKMNNTGFFPNQNLVNPQFPIPTTNMAMPPMANMNPAGIPQLMSNMPPTAAGPNAPHFDKLRLGTRERDMRDLHEMEERERGGREGREREGRDRGEREGRERDRETRRDRADRDRGERGERERGERDRGERGDRDRGEREGRGDRERGERGERTEYRSERGDREYYERGDHHERGEYQEKDEREREVRDRERDFERRYEGYSRRAASNESNNSNSEEEIDSKRTVYRSSRSEVEQRPSRNDEARQELERRYRETRENRDRDRERRRERYAEANSSSKRSRHHYEEETEREPHRRKDEDESRPHRSHKKSKRSKRDNDSSKEDS